MLCLWLNSNGKNCESGKSLPDKTSIWLFVFTGKLFIYGLYILDHLMKPEIIHAKFPSKTSLALNWFTLVQSTALTNLKRLSLTQDFCLRSDPMLQKIWWMKKTVWKLMLVFEIWKKKQFSRNHQFSIKKNQISLKISM